MSEGGALGLSIGIDENEAVPSFHRLPVPEPVGLFDPGRAFGDVHNQTLEAIAKAVRPYVVGERALGGRREGCADRGEDQDQNEAVGKAATWHGSDSFVDCGCYVWIRPISAPPAGAP